MEIKADTERALVDEMFAIVKEGSNCRDTPGAVNPHRTDTVEHFLHIQGWLVRDLQIALCRADPKYRKSQGDRVPDTLLNTGE